MIGCKGLPGFSYIKHKEGGREQDSGETERECVCERSRALGQEKDSTSNKTDHERINM
jgi:hypothetical protein